MRWSRGVVAIAAVLVGLAGTKPAAAQVFVRVDELLSLTLINASRATAGAAPLRESPQLDVMARAQAARMAGRGEIYHNPNLASDATKTGLHWLRVGENVGVGPDIPVIHQAFLDSPHHRDNLLFPSYNLMGVGVAPGTGDKAGTIFVAHVFAQVTGVVGRPASPTPRAVPRVVPPTQRPTPARLETPVPVETPAPTPVPVPTPNAVLGGVVDTTTRIAG
jgi:hypothetical protein